MNTPENEEQEVPLAEPNADSAAARESVGASEAPAVEPGVLEVAEEEFSDTEGDASEEEEVQLSSALEAILFAAAEPIPLQRLSRLFQGQGKGAVKKVLQELQQEFIDAGRGIRLMEVSSGYQLRSAPEHAPWLRRFFAEKPPRLSRALLETVSIIAYRQPVTRGEIESIRGVNCDAILTALVNRDLILATGRRDTPGRPVEYGTTSDFLELFTMRDLSDLPPLPDAESLANLLKEAPVGDATADPEKADMEASGEVTIDDGGQDPFSGGDFAAEEEGTSEEDGLEASPNADSGELEVDPSEASSASDTRGTPKAMAAAVGVRTVQTVAEPLSLESEQADGANGANSEDSQSSGSGFSPSS